MNNRYKSHEALECGHCGIKNRMEVIGSILDTEEFRPEDQAPYEDGTRYELHSCPACNKVVLVSGAWHDAMEGPEEWQPKVLLPESNDRTARQHFEKLKLDRRGMQLAVDEARKCVAEANTGGAKPKVGAVVALAGGQLIAGHRGELAPGDHAEFTVLEGKCKNERLAGATVYTTLEPCTTRNPPKIPCVDRLISRKVGRVVIGMLDPDERIRGRGVLALRKANIRVDLFPPELMSELEEMNREFIHEREHPASPNVVRNSVDRPGIDGPWLLRTEEEVYAEAERMAANARGDKPVLATSLGSDSVRPQVERYLEKLASRIRVLRDRGGELQYMLVVTGDQALAARSQIFRKYGVEKYLCPTKFDASWAIDVLIVDDAMLIGFPSLGEREWTRIGVRISDAEFVDRVRRWFETHLLAPSLRGRIADS